MSENKLALGTAQFGLAYGINNERGQISEKEAFVILAMAKDAGIDTIDTAGAYGSSEEILGSFVAKHGVEFKFISKFSQADNAAAELRKTLARLKVKNIYGYLLHHFTAYKDNPSIFDELVVLKTQGKVKKIGFSLYYPSELEFILKHKLAADIIQFPYSVFDQRFSQYLPELRKKNVEVHVRSVFLQGLIFKEPDALDVFFAKIKDKLIVLRKVAQEATISMYALCLQFVLMNKYVDKIVVGVDGNDHFNGILNSLDHVISGQIYQRLLAMAVNDEQLVVPSNWVKVRT